MGEEYIQRHIYEEESNTQSLLLDLDFIIEVRDKAIVQLVAYKQWMKQVYNKKVIPQSFHVRDLVWQKIKLVEGVNKL